MKYQLSKSDYRQFLECPEELWLYKHFPDLRPDPDFELQHNLEMGQTVDALAKKWLATVRHENSWPVRLSHLEFQKEVAADGFIARADISFEDPVKKEIALMEVKASTEVKDEHLHDIAFQQMVFEKAGFVVSATYLVYVNKEYVQDGTEAFEVFLKWEQVTAKVAAILPETYEKAAFALEFILGPEPRPRIWTGCKKKLSCPFVLRHFSGLPAYSVFDISRISQKNLQELVETRGVLDIRDVPDDFKLSKNQAAEVAVARSGMPVIDKAGVSSELSVLEYPLYFLDYESLAVVYPYQSGYRPYQQMVFQYSLHILEKPGAPLIHREFLLRDMKQPVSDLLRQLQEDMALPGGKVIVWNESFEKGRNKEMAELYPEYREFLETINHRVYDLMKVFQKNLFMHPGFKGKNTLKAVLPVLCPDLSYKALNIQSGNMAYFNWHHLMTGRIPEEQQAQLISDLLAYCHLDTLAMVRILEKIWEFLKV